MFCDCIRKPRVNASTIIKRLYFFNKNTSLVDKEALFAISGIPSTQHYDTYLELLALVGKSRLAAFCGIIDRVWRRLQEYWKLKFLSQAVKEILLKAVIQTIPSYCMSVFLLPKGLCSKINSHMKDFWWGHQAKDSQVHWMSWEKISLPSGLSGMGFRDFHSFNKALLAK